MPPSKAKILHHSKLPDINQSWWQLAAIQLTGVTSLPVLAGSVIIMRNSNFLSAIITLLIGNIILWGIRFGIISMSFIGRKNSLDITEDYFGKKGSFIIAVVLLLSTLAWFVMQTTLASNTLRFLVPIERGLGINRFMQIGVVIGILSTLFCMNGIVVIRWVSVIAMPILLVTFIGIIIGSGLKIPISNNGFSLSGLPIILATNLGVTVDIPTFFRHSKSKRDSTKALMIIQVVSLVIGTGGLFLGQIIEPWFGVNTHNGAIIHSHLLRVSIVVFVFVSAICANISNVYSSSVGWELLAPVLAGVKEYLILGLGLCIAFILASNIVSMDLLASLTDCALVNLCLLLVIAYLLFLILRRPANFLEKGIYFLAWFLATIVNILQFIGIIPTKVSPLFLGLCVMSVVLVLLLSFAYRYNKKLINYSMKKNKRENL